MPLRRHAMLPATAKAVDVAVILRCHAAPLLRHTSLRRCHADFFAIAAVYACHADIRE